MALFEPPVRARTPPFADRAFEGDDPLALGAAAALARTFDVDTLAVRVAFIVLAVAGGWGVLLYLAVWLLLVRGHELPVRPEPSLATTAQRIVGVVAVMLGALLVLRERAPGFADTLVWPVAVVGAGVVLGWRRLNVSPGAGTTAHLARLAGGFVLAIGGFTSLFTANLSVGTLRDTLAAVAVATVGVLLILGPWVVQLTRSLADERRERIRADERAEVATHLHDSVLQTLTLLQKRADDPKVMAALARHQERELRRWLYGGTTGGSGGSGAGDEPRTFRAALEAMASEVEDQHLVQVENVTVGDGPVDARLLTVVAAAREALVNAAKFSGRRTVSLYAELRDRHVEVFIRDRGAGFRPDAVMPDRKGISESIVGRMERLGGTAHVRSAPCAGTEVRLRLDRLDRIDRAGNGSSAR